MAFGNGSDAFPRVIRESPHGDQIRAVIRAALLAVSPETVVRAQLALAGDILKTGGARYDLARTERVCVLGAGKAAQPMAGALYCLLGDRLDQGAVIVKKGTVSPSIATGPVAVLEAAHPEPDEASVQATRQLVHLASGLGEADLGIVLVSGGASALMTLPGRGLDIRDVRETTALLLRSGATIQELNTVRRHLSAISGGQLAKRIYPAQTLALLFSDVVGDRLEAIGSGPTAPDPTTFKEARAVIVRYGLESELPGRVRERLLRGAEGRVAETLKAHDPVFEKVVNRVVGSNRIAAEASLAAARANGLNAVIVTTGLEGEARQVGKTAADLARDVLTRAEPIQKPACLILGGETTVAVRGRGKGGRNQEVALSAAMGLEGLDGAIVAALATDGEDGPTDAAGAAAGADTLSKARALGLDASAHLDANDAYPYFEALGDLIRLGPTRTNVADLIFVFAF